MGVDLEAIRRKVQELNSGRKFSKVQLWKPALGEYRVRGLPWKETQDGQPFRELWFYYFVNPGVLAPYQFGKPDPINDLIRKCYASGKPEDKELAKKLRAKMRAYMPVIVRGEENQGVRVWSFGKGVHMRLLSYYLGESECDILSPTEGFDLKVTLSKQQNKQFTDTNVDLWGLPMPKPSRLAASDEDIKKLLDSVPDIKDLYKQKTAEEIEHVLNSWLAGDTVDDGSDGTSRGERGTDALDDLVNEVKGGAVTENNDVDDSTTSAAPAAPVQEAKPGKKGKSPVKKEAGGEARNQSLDDAFEELMK